MNICTYVSAVSMRPKRYIVAVYHQTQSLQNMINSKRAVLQLLDKQHLSLVNTLGKKSGLDFDKEHYLKARKLLQVWNDRNVLSNCAALMEVEKIWRKDAGDHTLFLFDVVRYKTNRASVLMLDDLRKRKLVRM